MIYEFKFIFFIDFCIVLGFVKIVRLWFGYLFFDILKFLVSFKEYIYRE